MRMTKGGERTCCDWWLICTYTAWVVHIIVYCFSDIIQMPTLPCSSYVHVWCRYMPQSLSAINWTITPCNYYPSAIFRRWMLMNEAYYVSLEPSLRSMYSLSRRWSIAFLISGTFGVNLVLGSAWPIPLLQDSLQRSVRWPLESMLDAWESTNQPCPLAPLWWTHLSTLHQSHDRSLINESSVLLYRLQHLCSLHLELRSSGHI